MKTDKELRQDVLEELDWDESIDASQIGVTTYNGVVTLIGQVPTHADKRTAEELTKRVHGVKAIASEIEVRPGASHQRYDEQLAMAAVHALEWDGKVPHDRVQVVVSDGWITLEGTTEHRFERDAAERAIRHLIGVRGVANRLIVEPEASRVPERKTSDRIEDEIERALLRSSMVNSKQIGVEVKECTAILTGVVRSLAEYDEVERIAWMAPGISQVENCVAITLG